MSTDKGADKRFILRRKDIKTFMPLNVTDHLLIRMNAAAEKKTNVAMLHDMILGYNRCILEQHDFIIDQLEAERAFFIMVLRKYVSKYGTMLLRSAPDAPAAPPKPEAGV